MTKSQSFLIEGVAMPTGLEHPELHLENFVRMQNFMDQQPMANIGVYQLLGEPAANFRRKIMLGFFRESGFFRSFSPQVDPSRRYSDYYPHILDLSIPEDVKALGFRDDHRRRDQLERTMRAEGLPYLVLVMGEEEKTSSRVAILYAVSGIAPQTGLDEVKELVREHRIRLN